MANMFTEYPYNNYSDINLDWVISKVKELDDFVSGGVGAIIEKYINKVMPDVLYNAEDESITLQVRYITVDDGTHTYVPSTKTLEIKKEDV